MAEPLPRPFVRVEIPHRLAQLLLNGYGDHHLQWRDAEPVGYSPLDEFMDLLSKAEIRHRQEGQGGS